MSLAIPQSPPARTGTVIRAAFGRAAPGTARLNAEERAFLPAALEVIETPASPTLRLTAGAICALLTAATVWCCVARIDEVAVAAGRIVPLGQVKVVQPLETARIRTIRVDDGDHVAAGQLLVDLDPTEVEADLKSLGYDRGQAALDAEAARVLIGDDPGSSFTSPEGVDPAVAAQTRRKAVEDLNRHRAEMAGLAADGAEKRAALAANAAQLERDRALIPLLQERFDVAKELYDKRFAAKPPMLDAEQQLVEKQADLKAASGTAAQIEAQLRSLEAKRGETEAAFLADALDRRAKAQSKMAELDGEIGKAAQKASYRRLVAPVAGTVQNLKVHTPGAVVTAADVLMDVVPDGAGIEIDAGVDNKDIGFVREGQDVAVKVDAFPFTRYGLVHGTLRTVGRDAAERAQPGPGVASTGAAAAGATDAPPTYPAKVALAQDWIVVDGRHERLQPGMRVAAEIKTGDRRVIEYLLSPVLQAAQEAGRER